MQTLSGLEKKIQIQKYRVRIIQTDQVSIGSDKIVIPNQHLSNKNHKSLDAQYSLEQINIYLF